MTKTVLLKAVAGVFFLIYPFIIYVGLGVFEPKWFALLLFTLAVIRLLASKDQGIMKFFWLGAAGLVLLATLLTGSPLGLYLYPVIVSLIFLSFFFSSLYYPPTIIERFARKFDPELSPEGVRYTRTVTKVWCMFFLTNASLSIISLQISQQYWLLYNGFISYCLMGTLFAGEYLIRRRVMSVNDA